MNRLTSRERRVLSELTRLSNEHFVFTKKFVERFTTFSKRTRSRVCVLINHKLKGKQISITSENGKVRELYFKIFDESNLKLKDGYDEETNTWRIDYDDQTVFEPEWDQLTMHQATLPMMIYDGTNWISIDDAISMGIELESEHNIDDVINEYDDESQDEGQDDDLGEFESVSEALNYLNNSLNNIK